MPLYQFEDKIPTIKDAQTNWIAPCATLIGDIIIKEQASIWFGAILRGDNEPITIGAGSNVQENVVMHTDPGYPLTIAADCTIGHKAMLHGCTIGENSLIGMGATVLNGARIGKNSLVGAHTLVSENKSFPDGSLILGTPGKVARSLSDEEIENLKKSAQSYKNKIIPYQKGLKRLDATISPEL